MSQSTQTSQADLCYVKRCSCVVVFFTKSTEKRLDKQARKSTPHPTPPSLHISFIQIQHFFRREEQWGWGVGWGGVCVCVWGGGGGWGGRTLGTMALRRLLPGAFQLTNSFIHSSIYSFIHSSLHPYTRFLLRNVTIQLFLGLRQLFFVLLTNCIWHLTPRKLHLSRALCGTFGQWMAHQTLPAITSFCVSILTTGSWSLVRTLHVFICFRKHLFIYFAHLFIYLIYFVFPLVHSFTQWCEMLIEAVRLTRSCRSYQLLQNLNSHPLAVVLFLQLTTCFWKTEKP